MTYSSRQLCLTSAVAWACILSNSPFFTALNTSWVGKWYWDESLLLFYTVVSRYNDHNASLSLLLLVCLLLLFVVWLPFMLLAVVLSLESVDCCVDDAEEDDEVELCCCYWYCLLSSFFKFCDLSVSLPTSFLLSFVMLLLLLWWLSEVKEDEDVDDNNRVVLQITTPHICNYLRIQLAHWLRRRYMMQRLWIITIMVWYVEILTVDMKGKTKKCGWTSN